MQVSQGVEWTLRRTLASLCATVLGAAHQLPAQAAADSAKPTAAAPLCRWQPFPTLGAAPETGLQYGLGLLTVCDAAVARASTRPSSLLAYALGTTRRQSQVGIELERWSTDNAGMAMATVVWQSFPLPYFGIGDGTSDATRELYTPRGIEVNVGAQQRFAPGWYVGASARHVSRRISTDSAGALRRDRILGTAAGPISEFGITLQQDTRDNIFETRRGQWLQLNYTRSDRGPLSSYSYGRWRTDTRFFRGIGGGHVLAVQAQIIGIQGAAPFDQLPLVGGSEILRGYELGRYRDRWLTAVQAEYRTPIVRRVGAVAFAGAGLLAPAFGQLTSQRGLPTFGIGLRGQLDAKQRTAVRADFGWGRPGASGLYLGVGQAF